MGGGSKEAALRSFRDARPLPQQRKIRACAKPRHKICMGLIFDFSPAVAPSQGLNGNRKNKVQRNVKRLFLVIIYAVCKNQTAESCSTGGVIQALLARCAPRP